MTENESRLHQKLNIAAYLLLAGLAVQGITLHWAHPTSFLLFISVGGVLVLFGMAIYLIALVNA